MARQDQNIDHSEIQNSNIQQSQAGRDAVSFNNSRDNQVVIENTFLRLFGRSESNQVDWDWAKLLLEKKQLPEIRKRLTDTLGRARILMDVSIAEQQQWVNRLQADRQLQVNGKDGGLLDPNKMLIETFGRDDIAGKLLILGAPGSGKTTALLSLAEQLVMGAIEQPQTVIPVILELSTWREDSQSIEAWIIEQLYDLHGGNRKKKIYEKYLERQVLLPLLDGLDELGLERQKKCTEKLNEFARTYPQLVVCCRVREFETANIKLSNLNGAICLQELSDGQIESYFQGINRAELGSEVQTNSALQGLLQETAEGEPGLLRFPLFIKLLADVYDPQEPIKNKADLLEKYIERQLSFDQRERDRRKESKKSDWAYKTLENEPKLRLTINSLSWFARQLQTNNMVDLLIEKIQPNWIEIEQLKSLYSLMILIVWGIVFGLNGWLSFKSILGVFFGILSGLILGRIWDWKIKIKTVDTFQILISKTARRKFLQEFTSSSSLAFGVRMGTFMFFLHWLIQKPIEGMINGLLYGVFIWLYIGLIKGIDRGELKLSSFPNQGICNSFQSLFLAIIIFYTLSATYFMGQSSVTLFVEKAPINFNWIKLLGQAFLNGLNKLLDMTSINGWILFISFVFFGGLACIKHFSLRLILWQSGTIPWNLARFLNYCVERRLLLRVGGHYRFLHRELLDHFAQLPPETQIK
ncbi:MAG: NACHT domain-containing protein [Snowella sp.]|nr:NACHT domain-containing protein [Snowella sp.]